MDVILRTHTSDPSLKLLDLTWSDDDYTFSSYIVIRSGPFAGEQRFFFEGSALERFIAQLVEMDESLRGEAEFSSLEEDILIILEMQSLGRVLVRGEIIDISGLDQRLQFEFETDQTVLKPLISDLRAGKS